jgi:crotonobetainyl-CoA:carnitine CoA-transferase CaiB-like acyl-CoA transferase
MSASPVAVRAVAPRLGPHTGEVLGGLGHSAQDIDRLRGDGVV